MRGAGPITLLPSVDLHPIHSPFTGTHMFLGYNTNGFAFHRLLDAVDIIAEIGYTGVGLTVDYHALNPYGENLQSETANVREALEKHQLRSVVETGARFLLNPRQKHQPTLLSVLALERTRRIDFLCRCVDIAAELGADAVSFWSGTPLDDAGPQELRERLTEALKRVIAVAERRDVVLALEPEPGMFLDTVAATAEVIEQFDHPLLQWTIDVGHLHCQQEGDIPTILRSVGDKLANLHIEDMRRGVHDHLMFGEGEMEFEPILRTLKEVGYPKGVYVELSRHAHNAVEAARQAYSFLQPLL